MAMRGRVTGAITKLKPFFYKGTRHGHITVDASSRSFHFKWQVLTLYNENCTKDAVRKAIKTAGCALRCPCGDERLNDLSEKDSVLDLFHFVVMFLHKFPNRSSLQFVVNIHEYSRQTC